MLCAAMRHIRLGLKGKTQNRSMCFRQAHARKLGAISNAIGAARRAYKVNMVASDGMESVVCDNKTLQSTLRDV